MSEGEDPELLAFKAIANVIGGGILVLNSELRIISASLGSGAYFREDPSILRGQPIANILGLRNGGNSSIEASIREAPSKNNKIVSALALGEHHRLPVDVRINRIDYRNEYGFVLTLREAVVGREIFERTGELAHFDSLTGLPNRALFVERLIHAIARAEHDEHELTIVLVDLVRFGLINESLGLKKGDQLIKEAAQKLGQSLRQGDIVARLSGDQFIVLLDGIGSTELALQVSEKVLKEFRHPIRINGHEVSLHINIGISLYPADGSEADALIRNANSALEKAKQLGEYRFCFFTSDMNAFAYERLVLEGDMKKAIEEGQFRLHYQPIYKLTDFSIVGFEALMRWFHPTQGLIPPLEFIPIAEDTGRIEELGREAIKLACSDLVRWYDAGFSDARVAVNVSARQLVDPTLPDQIRLMLERNHLEGSALDLEITESALIQATENSRRTFDRLREVGASISIDDFGTGYSSIRTLRDYPIDCLKIDRSLIAAITNAPQESDRASGFAIARAIVALGEGLKIRVIAEGVETEAQLEAVRELGCEEAQGFLLGRPMPFDQTLDVLRFPNQLTLLSDE